MYSENNNDSEDPDIVYSYTAKQAVEDGIFHEIGKIGYEAGFKIPVRITSGVLELVTPDQIAQKLGQSYEGRLWDVLFMANMAIQKSKNDSTLISFEVLFQNGDENLNEVKLYAGLDATSGLAIHIMLPSEY